jgi:hypothetical protein
MAIGDPHVHLLHATSPQLFQQTFPGTVVLALADDEGQYLACADGVDPDHSQDRHLLARIVVDDGEIGPTRKDVDGMRGQGAGLSNLKLSFQRVKDPRNSRVAGMRACQPLLHL